MVDFDGTLVDLARHPDDVVLAPETRSVLETLSLQLDGALAIVTGRPIETIDRFMAPLLLPVAGVHGLTRRTAQGRMVEKRINARALALLHQRLGRFADTAPGVMLEAKPGSVALHYRSRPECESACLEAVSEATADLEDVQVLRGKMVVEAKAGKATKAGAVAEFMAEMPFSGRCPVFAGDDVTDEHAFDEVTRHGGLAIKIGSGPTAAGWRTDGTASFRTWLLRLSKHFQA